MLYYNGILDVDVSALDCGVDEVWICICFRKIKCNTLLRWQQMYSRKGILVYAKENYLKIYLYINGISMPNKVTMQWGGLVYFNML